ncbi:MAG: thiol:disulfide interchange protein DsbA/DsbL, partial [Xanthomonadaceae bacterium]|nr:thiol:disulfide interchange protein DsbA/DsbL [Xanthomonadaceae bacterium]
RISGPNPGSNGDGVEVVEVFSYMCPHCRSFQPYVSRWEEALPEQVTFRRVPVSFNRSWEPFARAYYTAELLDVLDESHETVFVALHDERKQFRSMSELAQLYEQHGIEPAQFESTAKSFPVESRMRTGNAEIGKWQVRSTPTLVIDGTWRVSPRRGSTFDEMLEIADYVLAMALESESERLADRDSQRQDPDS